MEKRAILVICILFIGMNFIPLINSDDPLRETILYVGGLGSGNYSSIQSAINAALSGNSIYVYTGIYYENLFVDKQIKLFGEDRVNTIIDGGGNSRVVRIYADNVSMKGFTIQNGYEQGVQINSNQNVITENIFQNNEYA
ncbi:unnamed protein product, partial [marine sediment metagenome]